MADGGTGTGTADDAAGDDEGYVHDPGAVEGTGVTHEDDAGEHGADPRAAHREFDWRGWILVGMIVVAFLVVPAALYFLPRASGAVASLGLSLRDAYLVLPLVPALVLGALAVWATTRP